MTKAQMENQRKMHEMAMKDDLARDKMAQDLYVDAAKLCRSVRIFCRYS